MIPVITQTQNANARKDLRTKIFNGNNYSVSVEIRHICIVKITGLRAAVAEVQLSCQTKTNYNEDNTSNWRAGVVVNRAAAAAGGTSLSPAALFCTRIIVKYWIQRTLLWQL